MKLKMKSKLFSLPGIDYTVYDFGSSNQKDGIPILKIDGKLASDCVMHIRNLQGNLIAILHGTKSWLKPTKFDIQNANKQKVAMITFEAGYHGNLEFRVKSIDKTITYYIIKGSFYGGGFIVRNNHGDIVGKSLRERTKQSQTYYVDLCKGFDYVLMVLIMLAVDQFQS